MPRQMAKAITFGLYGGMSFDRAYRHAGRLHERAMRRRQLVYAAILIAYAYAPIAALVKLCF